MGYVVLVGFVFISVVNTIFLKHISLNRLMLLSFMVSIIAGFKFVTNDILDAQRVIGFYPFYLVGIWLNGLKKDLINLPPQLLKYANG